METAFFWIAWGVISFWVLKTFYFSYHKDKLRKLRFASSGINLSVLVLFLLPWLGVSQQGFSGLELIFQGNMFVIFLGILIAGSTLAFLTTNKFVLKVGAIFHVISSVLFIFTMIRLMPGTFVLTLQSIAPIIASLLLLVGNVVVLLLWQQIQLLEKKRR